MFLTKDWRKFKIVVNGDPSQVDLINKNQSGLIQSTKNFKKYKRNKNVFNLITKMLYDILLYQKLFKLIKKN